MHDPIAEMLSAYIDGDLVEADRTRVESHVRTCPACRELLDELRDVVVAAAALKPTDPAADLWPGIAARIGASTGAAGSSASAGSTAVAGALAPAGDPRFGGLARRRFSMSLPQLAAAAVVLMTMSGGLVWMLEHRGGGESTTANADPAAASGAIVYSAGGAPAGPGRLVDTPAPGQDAFDQDVAELERALDENRASLDPATVEVVERSIESIDAAIRDAREALASDPGNPYLHRQLDSSMRMKLDVLRRATRGAS